MNIRFKFFFAVVAFCCSLPTFAQYIFVDEGFTAQQLVEDVLINSSCATVSNVSVSGGNFSDGAKSWGFFNGNNSSFPFQNGIILATGKISNAPGPNTSLSDDGGNMGWDGDQDLNQALNLNNTFNATVLEFDFVPVGNQVSFDFIFSSEQYLTSPTPNQCNFTDGFAFLLKEANTTQPYQNLAVIPNTNIPVRVNTVRGPGTICPPANEAFFDAFNGDEHPTNYNGQTKVLVASANVTPGITYHIKLVIADEGNHRFDSAIFLGGGSFNFGINLGDDRLVANGNPVCENETVTIDATSTDATSYQWFLNNNPLPGETNPTLTLAPPFNPTIQEGIYAVNINFGPDCTTTSEITIEFAPDLQINTSEFTICDTVGNQDGITSFTTNEIIAEIFSNLPNTFQVQLFETADSTTPIAENYTNTTPFTQTLYAKITNVQGCYPAIPIQITINSLSGNFSNETREFCLGTSINLQAPTGFSSYEWNTNPIQNTPTISINQAGTYTVTITNNEGCSVTKTYTVTASSAPVIEEITVVDFATSNSATILTSGIGTYEYSLDGTNFQSEATFTNLSPGMYTVYVTDIAGCGTVSRIFYILDYPKYFTPNNDGFNDYWFINNLSQLGLQNYKIAIFDRYGKLIKQLTESNDFWDGTFNGQPLPSQDYWFVLELPNGRIIRNHFSLIR